MTHDGSLRNGGVARNKREERNSRAIGVDARMIHAGQTPDH